MNAFTKFLFITARVSKDNGMSLLLMIFSWVFNQHLPETLLNDKSLVKLLSKRFIHGIKPQPAIQKDVRIRVSLIINSVTILDKYVIISINME